jgi:hypothetical protein
LGAHGDPTCVRSYVSSDTEHAEVTGGDSHHQRNDFVTSRPKRVDVEVHDALLVAGGQ